MIKIDLERIDYLKGNRFFKKSSIRTNAMVNFTQKINENLKQCSQ